jgi:hypothetical protein
MLILDENVIESQRQILLRARLHFRQIGLELERKGIGDDDIHRLLHRLHQPRLFTRDLRLFRANVRHPRFCVAVLSVSRDAVAACAVRLLHHPMLRENRQRMGALLNVWETGIRLWRYDERQEHHLDWPVIGHGRGRGHR